jgi:putative DNA methylase
MTRMIERWFPSAEVTSAASAGWGTGNAERKLFTWFAARPVAQARAAVLCSLLPWPEDDHERARLQALVREAMTGRDAAWEAVRTEITAAVGSSVALLDPFSGRGMIPLEAARLGLAAVAVDYAPVAVLASELLTTYPFADWSSEPRIPFEHKPDPMLASDRLIHDVASVLAEVGERHHASMAALYPVDAAGVHPWGYVWAVTLPCQECGRRFPVIGKNLLREPGRRRTDGRTVDDPGQSYRIRVDRETGRFWAQVEDGPPAVPPTLVNARDASGRRVPGKSAVCAFCGHVHPLDLHRRLTNEGRGRDALLLVADHDPALGKLFRPPTEQDLTAVSAAPAQLAAEKPFSPLLPPVPDEAIAPGNNNIIGPSIYGARTFGDLMCDRQTLYYVRLCRTINEVADDLRAAGFSQTYVRALCSYAAANMVRLLRYSTRGAWLHTAGTPRIAGIFLNEGSLSYSYDFFEAGIGHGPGTWRGLESDSVATLRGLMPEHPGRPVDVSRGTATSLKFAEASFSAVVTDPPYDEMIAYADSSDVFYCWLRRALLNVWPEFAISSDPSGAQEKELEVIVKRARGLTGTEHVEHRTREHYDRLIGEAFGEMARCVRPDGVVTIVFGHGDPEVWKRLLVSMDQAGLVMTGSWPAKTESGGRQGKANIQTTLTMACRPAPVDRSPGNKGAVEAEIKWEIGRRYSDWARWGFAPADMLMASAGPAMEVVGRYSEVLDARGDAVEPVAFLPLARAAVQAEMAVEVDHRPLEAFDARTRFALWWVRLYGRQPQAKSELRWQVLAASLDLEAVRDLVEGDKGVAFITSDKFEAQITPSSAVIDVALALAAASEQGLAAMGEVLASSSLDSDDQLLWAAIQFLADRLPDSDPDAIAFHRVLRARGGIGSAAENVVEVARAERARQDTEDRQIKLL